MATPLSKQRCEPCNANTPPLGASERAELLDSLHDRWRVQEDHHLTAHFPFPSFSEGLEFTSRVGRLAEEEGHHPEIRLSADGVRVRIWTHAIDALSENDFILAAKIDNLAS